MTLVTGNHGYYFQDFCKNFKTKILTKFKAEFLREVLILYQYPSLKKEKNEIKIHQVLIFLP